MSEPKQPSTRTYALVGANFEDTVPFPIDEYAARRDVVTKLYSYADELPDIAKHIRGDANIIMAVHGTADGSFTWNNSQLFSYADFFRTLPRQGVHSLVLGSCFADSALSDEALRAAPMGTIIIPSVHKTYLPISVDTASARESAGLTRPMDLYIKVLDNYNAELVRNTVAATNIHSTVKYDTDPQHALPHLFAIAGDRPERIDMDHVIAGLHQHIDAHAWGRATARVQHLFDVKGVRFHARSNPQGEVEFTNNGPQAEAQLHANIAAIAAKLPKGFTPHTFEERRISYALAAAYFDESGELQRRVDAHIRRDANGKLLDANALPQHKDSIGYRIEHQWNETVHGITAQEQAYINSVSSVLTNKGTAANEAGALLKQIVTGFSATHESDFLDHGLATTLRSKGINTQGWEK